MTKIPNQGIGMFICTYIYMYVWVYTGEVSAKRLRESYLRAVLRQDIAFFDDVGAGEVTTRIQTDTRTSIIFWPPVSYSSFFSIRLSPNGDFRENGNCCQFRLCFYHRFYLSLCSFLETRFCIMQHIPCNFHCWLRHE